MPDPAVARLSAALVSRAGGYLRNTIRQDRVTCAVCTTPAAGYLRCFPCNAHLRWEGLAEAVAVLTYAVAGQQSGYVMLGYKAGRPLEEHRTIVALLVILALTKHADCPGILAGTPVTHWATVPSLPAKPGEHPLHGIVRKVAPGREVVVAASARTSRPREINPEHFSVGAPLPRDSHVLLMDDTWASGGHAQSAVLALRKAQAAHVSLLVVARWIKEDFGDNATFLHELSDRDFDPGICPWTGADCPGRA